MPNDMLIPAVPSPPDGARSLVLELGDHRRMLFDLAGRMPTESQWHRMARRIARDMGPGVNLQWRWIK